nr:PH23-57 [Vibrio phage 1]
MTLTRHTIAPAPMLIRDQAMVTLFCVWLLGAEVVRLAFVTFHVITRVIVHAAFVTIT